MLTGSCTALVTPFKDGRVDVEALAAIAEHQIASGTAGLVPCGTTGESVTMNAEERALVIRTVVEAAKKRVPVIAGAGSNDTRASIAMIHEAKRAGADFALCVTPYYNKPTQSGLVAHCTHLATEGGLPIVVYNVPGRTGVSLTAESWAQIAKHPGIVAIKEASANLQLCTEMIEAASGRSDIAYLSGDDGTVLGFLAHGGCGTISVVSNVAPRLVADLCAAGAKGDFAAGRILQARVTALAKALFAETNPIPIKAAMAMAGHCGSEIRLPLTLPGSETMAKIEAALRAEKLI